MSNGVPFIQLDKTRYASGEAVFFWVGVRAVHQETLPSLGQSLIPMTDQAIISREYQNTCRLTITRPDGTQKIDKVTWPLDGLADNGWQGGHGLGEQAQVGRYLLVFEFAGQKTNPTPLIVENVPLLKKIKGAFVFGQPSHSPVSPNTPVTFTVTNGSDQVITFPHRDGLNAMVSVSLSKIDGGYGYDFFYPADKLLDADESKTPDHGYDEFTWIEAQHSPAIIVKPGGVYQQRLSLRAALAEAEKSAPGINAVIPPGQYRVTFSTTLQILIGSPEGSLTAISPVHIPVVSTATYIVTR